MFRTPGMCFHLSNVMQRKKPHPSRFSRRLETSSSGVGFAVERGETIAREDGLQLIK